MHTYETDFAAWADEQSQALAENRIGELDLTNLAEEIASLSRSDRRALRSHIRTLTMHLLKWQAQPYDHTSSWVDTIEAAREEIEYLLKDSPSLRNETSDMMRDVYRRAVAGAAKETHMRVSEFPKECPFTFEELMTFPLADEKEFLQ
jgi:Domain of unknown function DUF29